jgi:hypothetical protein
MERCPCCNARLTGVQRCPRCQADLGSVLDSEQLANYWLGNSIHFWLAGEPQRAILAITQSINVKQTPLALVFRDFTVRQQCQTVLGLLEKRDYTEAKESLSLLSDLNPHNKLLKQLYGFSRYLLATDIIGRTSQQTINIFNELNYS